MKKILKLALGLVCALGLAAAASEASAMTQREVLNFNTGWLYSPSDYTNAQLMLLDDSNWDSVSVPHANTVLTAHKGSDFQRQIESYRFVSWYRRHFTLPGDCADKRVIVEFQGVATVAEVYVNGSYVGTHKGAYTGFSFDITDRIAFGGSNVIAVRVDSTKRGDIPPEGGQVDYCLFGGIVRDVSLKIVNPVYADSTFITTPGLSDGEGKINSVTKVMNSSGRDSLVTAETVIYDAEGGRVASAISPEILVPAGESAEVTAETPVIENPRLWSVDDPYLYTARVNIIENGEAVDGFDTKIGLRWFEFTNTGFYLNGEKLELRGVNRHEQWPWQGRAIPNKLQIQDAELLKYTGFNAVRCSHYPQDPEFLDRCDELGLIVFEEAPGWQHVGDSAWQEVYKGNIVEMILRDRNHPSIVTWGVRVNESWDNRELYTSTVALSKELDPTRPTHGVRRNENYDSTEHIEDILCVNYQYPEVPRFTPFVVTEHSWEHWTDGFGFPWATDKQAAAFTESFANVVDYYYRNEMCAGGFAWSMFDYDNEVNYTNTGHVFYSGLYDIFRLDKPVSHFYRSQKEPGDEVVLYIANYWTEDSPSDVEVYSNCDEVELFVNGSSVGRIAPNLYTNVPHPAFRFTGIGFEAGELSAVGYIGGTEAARAVRRTPGAAAKLSLTPDYETLVADGTDMTSVTIALTDENGTRLPYADSEVTISVSGPAELIGENPIVLEGGRAAFLIKSIYHQAGTVSCTVSADGIESGSCELEILPYDDENTVPMAEADGSVFPLSIIDLNDTDPAFNYSAGWLYIEQANCHGWDNHYSNAAGDSLTVSFTGDVIEWYGSKAGNHGIMAVSVDGGPETFIDCYSETRIDNTLLYSSGSLGYGEHVLTVRVTGNRNASATDCYINADHVRVIGAAAGLKSRAAVDSAWDQPDPAWGDHMTIIGEGGEISLRATVPLPTAHDTGYGLLGRVNGDNNYYQLELKYENGGLVWGIWNNYGGQWLLLASGPYYAGESDSITLRLDMRGDEISAFASTGDGWLPLGACRDQSYASGGFGLRTHNTDGTFSSVAAYAMNPKRTADYELTDVTIKDGVLKSAKLSAAPGAQAGKLIAARYADDGSLELCSRFEILLDGSATLGEIPLNGSKVKLFVWGGEGDITPLGDVWEM